LESCSKNIEMLALVLSETVFSFCICQIICKRFKIVEMEQPYVSSFLGFREVEFYKSLLEDLSRERPDCLPQVNNEDGDLEIEHSHGI